MNNCINEFALCLEEDEENYCTASGRCLFEEDIETVQSLSDAIDDYSKCFSSILKLSSRLSYTAYVIHNKSDESTIEVLSLLKRYSILLYESRMRILEDDSLDTLIYTFNSEVQKWLNEQFLYTSIRNTQLFSLQSLHADLQTIEMALGLCVIEPSKDESLCELFF